MITQDLDQITNITSREAVLNHYAKETNSKLSSLFSARTVIGRTNSSSGVSCEFNDDFNDDNDDDIYESIYSEDTYLQTSEHHECQTSTTPASEETNVNQSANESVTESASQTATLPETLPVTQPVIQSIEEATSEVKSETFEKTPEQSVVRSQTPDDNSQARVNSIISRWGGSTGSFSRRASTRPQNGRRPIFRDSTRTRLVSQEMSERLLQRSENQDSVIEDPDSSNTNTNDDHESGTCVKCSFIPDNDNEVGFEGIVTTVIQESSSKPEKIDQLIESDWCSYEVLYDFDADEYSSIYKLEDSDEFLTVTESQMVKSNGINLG